MGDFFIFCGLLTISELFKDCNLVLGTIFTLRKGNWAFFEPPILYIRTFSVFKVRENCHFMIYPLDGRNTKKLKKQKQNC